MHFAVDHPPRHTRSSGCCLPGMVFCQASFVILGDPDIAFTRLLATQNVYRTHQTKGVVGLAGFEPAASSSRTKSAHIMLLRHALPYPANARLFSVGDVFYRIGHRPIPPVSDSFFSAVVTTVVTTFGLRIRWRVETDTSSLRDAKLGGSGERRGVRQRDGLKCASHEPQPIRRTAR